MEYLEVKGRARLGGEIDVHGSKNSVLPILAGSVLIKGESVIHNCPDLSDVRATIGILRHLGATVKKSGNTLVINAESITNSTIPENMMQQLRSSIIFLGSLVSRTGSACVYLPGGCEIGLRPIDMHLSALKSLGYSVEFDGENICCKKDDVKSAKIVLPFPSVGATENAILACVFIDGKTTIINAAREPEIEDLISFLNSAGAKIRGENTSVIEIEGVSSLHSSEHTVIPDRIEASTYMSISAITSSELLINKVNHIHLAPNLEPFYEMGCELYLYDNSLRIKPPKRPKRVKKIETGAFPGFPTDSQAITMAVLSIAGGSSMIKENIFESRFKHIPQLMRFGADITAVDSRAAIIHGVNSLHCAEAICTDLRGGAAVLCEALAAEGTSVIKEIEHIDRGYERIEETLKTIGADIKRKDDEQRS